MRKKSQKQQKGQIDATQNGKKAIEREIYQAYKIIDRSIMVQPS